MLAQSWYACIYREVFDELRFFSSLPERACFAHGIPYKLVSCLLKQGINLSAIILYK
jgi:hypothetical protein